MKPITKKIAQTVRTGLHGIAVCTALLPALIPSSDSAQSEFSDWAATRCVEIATISFQPEVSGSGSSCALFSRQNTAENHAEDAVVIEAKIACEALEDHWGAYCEAVCHAQGFAETTGIAACDYTVTDIDTWSGQGCATGDKQYARKEADVQCGCNCRSDL